MLKHKLTGTGVALVTPFTSNLKVDYNALGKLIDHCINGGVEYLVSLGTTGESVSLSASEKSEVLKFTVEYTNSRVPLVAGFGGNNTAQVISEINAADLAGVSAVLSVSPYYNKPTQAGIYAHYKEIATNTSSNIILYNVPGRTGSNMKAETTLQLASDFKNIIGMKEASGDFNQCMQLAKSSPEDFLLISGDDNFTLGLIAYGFHGVISVVGQAFPAIFSEMVRQSLAGNFENARTLHYKLNNITDMLFAEGNPGGVKYVLSKLGVCDSTLRLPLVQISELLKQKIDAEMGIVNG